jgi:parallel beta-helix repeat protein
VSGRVLTSVGGPVEYWARYGPTTAYGSETAHATVAVPKNGAQPVDVPLAGLARSTKYHFRICARDGQQVGDPSCGADGTFTTLDADCGETITTSIRFIAGMSCPPESEAGLVVGAPGIDINLGGHSLSMSIGSGVGASAIVNRGHANVTIRNGDLLGGDTIYLDGASGNSIRNVDVAGTGDAIHIVGGSANEVRGSTADGRGSGIRGVNSDGLVIARSRVLGTVSPGISVQGTGMRIAYNALERETIGSTPTAIEFAGMDNRATYNRITGQWARGGIVLLSGSGNVIADNEVDDLPAATAEARSGDGIFVGAFTAGTLLRDNIVQRNAGDGIEAQGTDARIGGNRAFDNGDFGIDAAAGVTDLGGNVATGNGNPLQCRNVFCS